MALKTCRECGAKISKLAKACPQCGSPSTAESLKGCGSSMSGCGCAMLVIGALILLALLVLVH